MSLAQIPKSGLDRTIPTPPRQRLTRHQVFNTTQLRKLDAKGSKTTFLRKIWSSVLLPRIIPLPVEATWTTAGYNLIFHFSLSFFGRSACTSHVDTSLPATRRFHHIDLALTEFYEAAGHETGAKSGVKYVLVEGMPAYPIPPLREWYELVTAGPPPIANRHPIYHASTRLVGWSHTILVVVELTVDENDHKDFKGLQWDLSTTTGISQIEKKEWTWRESSLFLPLGTTTMDEEQIEALAQAHLKKFPVYHLVHRNCAFFVMMMFGAITSTRLGDSQMREAGGAYRWLTMKRFGLLLTLIFVLSWYNLNMPLRVVSVGLDNSTCAIPEE